MIVSTARDARPPLLLVRTMNPILRAVLRTPLGRVVRPLALLEFDGRHTGRRFRVPVGWHEIQGEHIVVTPAPWRRNFHGGTSVTVYALGTRLRFIGQLDDDPDSVAASLQSLVEQRGSLRGIGVDIPPGHTVTGEDVVAVDRAIIRFRPCASD